VTKIFYNEGPKDDLRAKKNMCEQKVGGTQKN